MKDKKQKWEVQFEEYSNGKLDEKMKELEDNHSNEINDKKDTQARGETTKNYMKQKKQLEKIKENLPKIKHLVEFKEKVTNIKDEIDTELKNRVQISKLTEEQGKLDEENEKLMAKVEELQSKLKSKDISDNDRKSVKEELDKTNKRRAENNEKYGKNSGELLKTNGKSSKFEKVSDEDLKMMSNKLSIQISKTNFYANRLIKGYSIESIKTSDKAIDWKMKATGKEAKKMEQLKSATKDNSQVKEMTEEELAENVQKVMEEKEEGKSMVEVSEFEQKHPRLAKIKKFFTNIRNKIHKKDDNLQEEPKKEENKEEKENKEEVHTNKHKEFTKILQNMDEYQIFDVAEKGLDGIKQEKMEAAKKKLQENKEKHANGLTAEEKGTVEPSQEQEDDELQQ